MKKKKKPKNKKNENENIYTNLTNGWNGKGDHIWTTDCR